MININDVNQAIIHGDFTNDQLDSIIMAIKFRRSQIGREIKRSVRVGDRVQFYHPKMGKTLSGPVTGVKIKNIVVSTPVGTYRVPANMVEVI